MKILSILLFAWTVLGQQQQPAVYALISAAGSPNNNCALCTDYPTWGGLATLYGFFPGVTTGSPSSLPLPATFNGVSVKVGDSTAYLLYVSSTQINIQMPWAGGFDDGPCVTDCISVVVTVNGVSNQKMWVPFGATQPAPAIFEINAQHQGAILDASYALVGPSNPTTPDSVILVYATGLGVVTPEQKPGAAAPSFPPVSTVHLASAFISGIQAPVVFSGLAPGFAGLYQVNVLIPYGLLSGPNELTISMPGVNQYYEAVGPLIPSNSVFLSVK